MANSQTNNTKNNGTGITIFSSKEKEMLDPYLLYIKLAQNKPMT